MNGLELETRIAEWNAISEKPDRRNELLPLALGPIRTFKPFMGTSA